MRPLLLTLLLCCATSCGLFSGDQLSFREYPLRDIGYDEAFDLVHDITREFYVERLSVLGGFDVSIDKKAGLLKVRPVIDGNRRMTLYMTLEPRDSGAVLAMLALVEHLEENGIGAVAWTRPLPDIEFEKVLYRAYLEEIVRRREG